MATNIYTGRRILYTDATELFSPQEVLEELSDVIPIHLENAAEIQFLMDYYKGDHAILRRTKDVREDIDYKIVVNYAQSATRDIVGYYLGKPISYVARKAEQRQAVKELSDYAVDEHKDTVDFEVAENQSICGVGYKAVFPDKDFEDAPFNLASLDPRTTFVVYSNELGNRPVWACSYYNSGSWTEGTFKTVYTVWDKNRSYVVTVPGGTTNFDGATISAPKLHLSKGLPIVEFPNNQWRLGDWETSIALMDAIDTVASDSVNDIAQFVQSFLVFVGAELPEKQYDENGAVTYDPYMEMKRNKLITLVPPAGVGNGNVDVKYIANTLDASNVSQLRDYLEASLRVVIGVPDRKTRGGGGGDTGDAVYMRDGWQDIDLVASNKEMFAVKAEKQVVKVMLNLCAVSPQSEIDSSLMANDIDIKFSRTKTSNIMTKAQAYATIVSTKTITPEDSLAMVDLTTDEGEVIQRGEEYWEGKAEMAQAQFQPSTDNVGNANDTPNDSTQDNNPDEETGEGHSIN